MSRALANAAPLTPQIRLAQAVSQFEADLSAEQKAAYSANRDHSRRLPPDISDVMRLTGEIDRRTSRRLGGGGRCFGPRFINVLQAVQHFAALGDIVVGGTQNIIACGVWSLVRMTLLSVADYSSFLDKLSLLFMVIGRSAPRYERMALLYPRSKALQSQLCEYFIVVVRLCHQVLKLSKTSILRQLVSFPNDSDMKNYQSELDRWASSIRDEVNLLMGEEQSSRFKVLLKYTDSESHRRTVKARVRVLNSCSTYDFQATWKEIRKTGNSTFYNQTTEYQGWKAATESCTLVCTGRLGSGKSVLLASIVNDLNLDIQSAEHPVAYFFCRHYIPESLKARTVLGALARQFLRPVSDLNSAEELLKDTTVLDLDALRNVLDRALPPGFKAYCVLDGLDECDMAQRQILIQQLRELQKTFSLIICVSFRLEAGNVLTLSPDQLAKQRIISIPVDNPDIGDFISSELEARIKSEELMIGDPRLIIEIEDALLLGAQGMFLWVALQIDSLKDAKTDQAIRRALADLPKDLPETFSRILKRSGELGKEYQTRTLELVAVAQRPLTMDELREALSVVPGDPVWDQSRLLNDIHSALVCCGSLIVVDEEEATVRLTHHSVKQFLFDNRSSTGAISAMDQAEKKMAEIVITYLNYGVFDTRVSTTVVPKIPSWAAPSVIIHSTGTPNQIRSLALKLLQSRRRPDFDMGKTIADASKGWKRADNQFPFHSYARTYLLRHAKFVLEQGLPMYNLVLTTINRDMDSRDDDGIQALLFSAVEAGCIEVIELLLATGKAELDAKDSIDNTPLLRASMDGREAVVALLLATGKADVNAVDWYGRAPLWWAARYGHVAVAELLLSTGKADIDVKDRDRRTPLLCAAMNGNKAIVRRLLETGKADVNAKERGGRTPLIWAALLGHESIAMLLVLEGKADVLAKDDDGETALSWARTNGHVVIVAFLIRHSPRRRPS